MAIKTRTLGKSGLEVSALGLGCMGMSFAFQTYKSPVGLLYLVSNDDKLCALVFERNWEQVSRQYDALEHQQTAVLTAAHQQLDEYFAGKRTEFDVPYVLTGTKFQNAVWAALAKIPFGQTWTYKQQAVAVNSPKAVRAIGRTNGLNPISIILPCHRVIGSDGSLTGYGGGLEVKAALLRLEGKEFDKPANEMPMALLRDTHANPVAG